MYLIADIQGFKIGDSQALKSCRTNNTVEQLYPFI